jgi:hypothetical protein
MEVATIYRCLRGLGTSWAHYWINMVLAWPKSRCYTVAVSMEMLGNACSRMHALLSSQLSVAAVWHASERLLAAVERRCRPCMTTDRAEVLRRMLVRAMLSYTVRYRTAHIDASKPTLGCQRRMLMFELLD